MKTLAALVALPLALALAAPAEAASTARASGNVRIHAGPAMDYAVVGRLPNGAEVYLRRCTRSGEWCQLDDGRGGWVLAANLVGMAAKMRATPPTFLVPFFGTESEDRDDFGLGTFPFR